MDRAHQVLERRKAIYLDRWAACQTRLFQGRPDTKDELVFLAYVYAGLMAKAEQLDLVLDIPPPRVQTVYAE